jgi:hypothetical protein
MAAEKLCDSFRPVPPKKTDAGAPAPSPAKSVTAGSTPMSSTAGDLSTPTARAKSTVGSTITAEPISTSAATAAEATEVKASEIAPPLAGVAEPGAQTIPSPPATTGVQSAAASAATTVAKPATLAAKPGAATAAKLALDPASEAALVEFLERQILPYLSARRGEKFQLNNPRFSDDTFCFAKLRVAEAYRSRVEEIQVWCDERRMLDLQTKLHHWLHAWLFVHVPFSFLLLMLTAWHAFVTLFYY